MSPGVRSFMLGFVAGAIACMGFITYYTTAIAAAIG